MYAYIYICYMSLLRTFDYGRRQAAALSAWPWSQTSESKGRRSLPQSRSRRHAAKQTLKFPKISMIKHDVK